jgi:hypothetical protein
LSPISSTYSLSDIRRVGYTKGEFTDASYNATELKTAGFTATELKTTGFTATELKTAGFTATELKTTGFTATELKTSQFSLAELVNAGFLFAELADAQFSFAELALYFPIITGVVNTNPNNYKNIYISGTKFVNGSTVSFGGSLIPSYSVLFISESSLKVKMVSPYEITSVTVTDISNNISNNYVLLPNELLGNICFIAGTPITTDQGNIPIEKINPSVHTIRNKKIVAITKNITLNKYLVCFEKDALGINTPSQKTIISKNHKLCYNGEMRNAKEFIKDFEHVTKVKYTGTILYNVLLEEHDTIMVNNMICETLHPENGVAKVYLALQTLNSEDRQSLINKINAHALKNKVFSTKKLSR